MCALDSSCESLPAIWSGTLAMRCRYLSDATKDSAGFLRQSTRSRSERRSASIDENQVREPSSKPTEWTPTSDIGFTTYRATLNLKMAAKARMADLNVERYDDVPWLLVLMLTARQYIYSKMGGCTVKQVAGKRDI